MELGDLQAAFDQVGLSYERHGRELQFTASWEQLLDLSKHAEIVHDCGRGPEPLFVSSLRALCDSPYRRQCVALESTYGLRVVVGAREPSNSVA